MVPRTIPAAVQLVLPSSHTVLPAPFSRHACHDSVVSTTSPSPRPAIGSPAAQPFLVIHPSFLEVLGPAPSLRCVASDCCSFAHEAGVWVEATGQVWFTSNLMPTTTTDGEAALDLTAKRSQVSTLDVETGKVQNVALDEHVGTGNGGCPYGQYVLFCEQGRGPERPSSIVAVNPLDPRDTHVVLNNFHGRPFNSINDAILLPPPAHFRPTGLESTLSGGPPEGWTLWFTDPTYGHEQGFRPPPQLPSQVYVFNPSTGDVRCVADTFDHPNGIAFSPDGHTCYVTDTSHIHGTGKLDPHLQSTVYAFDVVWPDEPDMSVAGPSLRNRRVFAFCDTGVPDGIKCDKAGNVYSGCGDGIHVWNKYGTLIGKIILGLCDDNLGAQCANFCFVPGGRLVCLSEDKIYLVEGLAVEGALL